MAIPHQKLREIVFLLLFAKTHGRIDVKETESLIMGQLKVSKSSMLKAYAKMEEIEKFLPEIDNKIRNEVFSYDFERIQSVEKTALRLGTYEIFFEKNLSPKIVIAEANRLTKKFGSPAATAFVNAILDAELKMSLGKKVDVNEIKTQWEQLQNETKLSQQLDQK